MAFQLSPGVLVTERDLTAIVPAVSTTAGAFAGAFQWGPVEEVVTVDSENKLVERFGKPNDSVFKSFFTAANFLAYGNNLQVVRVVGSAARNAIANASATALLIKNEDAYENTYADGSANVGEFAAKYPGTLGNSLKVSAADANTFSSWAYKDLFDSAPSTSTYASDFGGAHDELHIIVIDEDGAWTGTAGTTLEKFAFVSKASDAKKADGSTNYYKNVLNGTSKYVYWMDHPAAGTNWGTAAQGVTFANLVSNVTASLSLGVNDAPSAGNVQTGYSLFANDEKFDVSLICAGEADTATANYIINSVAEVRKDCVAFISPELADVVNNLGDEANDVVAFRNTLPSSSYAVMDSGWKYQYDRYNDKYRWVPLNGDVAGCAVRTDFVADPWFSPAGLNRGQIKNVVKLAFSPSKTERDTLYKAGVNPVVTLPGQGTVLFGDKTLLAKPSAFDRINVRRLFIVLEKAVATAAKFQLFEFNDQFTRAQFKNLVEPFLRDVQGRRGITDFKVVCDETNNTGEVIDRNEFVADIFIKPARAINFIQLNFIATRSGISFEEVGA
jgi:phage tail sheath protein FI